MGSSLPDGFGVRFGTDEDAVAVAELARASEHVGLGVDASSPTRATRLYEPAGMSVYRDTVFLERPVRRS